MKTFTDDKIDISKLKTVSGKSLDLSKIKSQPVKEGDISKLKSFVSKDPDLRSLATVVGKNPIKLFGNQVRSAQAFVAKHPEKGPNIIGKVLGAGFGLGVLIASLVTYDGQNMDFVVDWFRSLSF